MDVHVYTHEATLERASYNSTFDLWSVFILYLTAASYNSNL